MTTVRAFSAEENMRRLKMQKRLTFVVVEGSDDVPLYESCLMMELKNVDFDVIYSGGKKPIQDFLAEHKSNNAMFIVDKDFDDFSTLDARVVALDRYSIENYFICEEVISHSIKFAISCRLQDAAEAFDLTEFVEKITRSIEMLVKVLFYYQRHAVHQLDGKEKQSWSDVFLCENNSWELSSDQILALISRLAPTPKDIVDAEEYFAENFRHPGVLINAFPGKMLKTSLQRYIRQQVMQIKPGAKGKYNNVEDTRALLSSVLHHSSSLKNVLRSVVEFLSRRQLENG
ncbi:DUF4435 domain-containing protein [Pseudomonas ogarae]